MNTGAQIALAFLVFFGCLVIFLIVLKIVSGRRR